MEKIALDVTDRVEIVVNLRTIVRQNEKALELFKDKPRMQELLLAENERLQAIIDKVRV